MLYVAGYKGGRRGGHVRTGGKTRHSCKTWRAHAHALARRSPALQALKEQVTYAGFDTEPVRIDRELD